MVFEFDFNLEAWIKGVQVEADSEDEAIEKLYKMSLPDLLEAGGYEDESHISNIDSEIRECIYEIKVTSVDYDILESDLEFPPQTDEEVQTEIEQLKAGLPQTFELDVEFNRKYGDCIDDAVVEAVSDKTGYLVNSVDYDVIRIK